MNMTKYEPKTVPNIKTDYWISLANGSRLQLFLSSGHWRLQQKKKKGKKEFV